MVNIIASLQQPKNVVIVAPLIGAIFAILVDIGFFLSLGPAWFTFFSLTEHVELALSATPAALILVGLYYGIVLVMWLTHKAIRKYILETGDRSLAVQRRAVWNRRVAYFLVVILASDAFLIYWMLKHETYQSLIVATILTLLASVIVMVYANIANELVVAVFTLSLCAASASVFGFYCGYEVQTDTREPYTLYLKNNHVLHGVVLIAGERGILFFDEESKKTKFSIWRDIKSVTRNAVFSAGTP